MSEKVEIRKRLPRSKKRRQEEEQGSESERIASFLSRNASGRGRRMEYHLNEASKHLGRFIDLVDAEVKLNQLIYSSAREEDVSQLTHNIVAAKRLMKEVLPASLVLKRALRKRSFIPGEGD